MVHALSWKGYYMKAFIVSKFDRTGEEEYTETIHVCNSHSLAIQKMESAALANLDKLKTQEANELFMEPGTNSVEIIEKIPSKRAEWIKVYGEFMHSTLMRFYVIEYEVETE